MQLQGGEGVRRLVETREHDSKFLGLNTEYWWGLNDYWAAARCWLMQNLKDIYLQT